MGVYQGVDILGRIPEGARRRDHAALATEDGRVEGGIVHVVERIQQQPVRFPAARRPAIKRHIRVGTQELGLRPFLCA